MLPNVDDGPTKDLVLRHGGDDRELPRDVAPPPGAEVTDPDAISPADTPSAVR